MPVSLRLLPLAFCLAVAGCETDPVRRCAGPELREVQTLDRLIAETRDRLNRGYVLERQDSGANVNFCLGGRRSHVGLSFCTDPGTRTRPVAIDTEAEERKLAALEARRAALQARIDARAASCARP